MAPCSGNSRSLSDNQPFCNFLTHISVSDKMFKEQRIVFLRKKGQETSQHPLALAVAPARPSPACARQGGPLLGQEWPDHRSARVPHTVVTADPAHDPSAPGTERGSCGRELPFQLTVGTASASPWRSPFRLPQLWGHQALGCAGPPTLLPMDALAGRSVWPPRGQGPRSPTPGSLLFGGQCGPW